MRLRFLISITFLSISVTVFSQNNIDLKADFDIDKKQIKIAQTIQYQNSTNSTLDTIYLNDWSNSFSTKDSPLALRFSDEFKTAFHFAKNEDRGFTVITVLQQNGKDVVFERLKDHIDVIKVTLNSPLKPGETYTLNLNYIVQVPSDKFTRYGLTNTGNFNFSEPLTVALLFA